LYNVYASNGANYYGTSITGVTNLYGTAIDSSTTLVAVGGMAPLATNKA